MSDLLPCPFCGEVPSIMSAGMAGQPRWQHPVNDTCPIAGHYLGGWDFPVQWNQRGLPAVQPDADELVGHMTKLIAAGLDRIEQLTAERDRLGRELNVAKYGRPDFAWSVHLAAMAELRAERDRLTAQLESTLKDRAAIIAERDALREDVEELDFLRHEGGPDSVAAIEAERDRLRKALEQFLIEYDAVDLANAEPSSLTAAVLAARAALKGESHDQCA